MMGALVVLEGIDGAGKDTLAPSFAQRLNDRGTTAAAVTRRDLPNQAHPLFHQASALHDLIWDSPTLTRVAPASFPPSYWPALLCSWFELFTAAVLRPALRNNDVVICAGWLYKFRARFSLRQDVDQAWLHACLSRAPQPDHVVLLDVTPEAAWTRKDQVNAGEMGGHNVDKDRQAEHFIRYQEKVRTVFLQDAFESGWTIISTTDLAPDDVVSQAVNAWPRGLNDKATAHDQRKREAMTDKDKKQSGEGEAMSAAREQGEKAPESSEAMSAAREQGEKAPESSEAMSAAREQGEKAPESSEAMSAAREQGEAPPEDK